MNTSWTRPAASLLLSLSFLLISLALASGELAGIPKVIKFYGLYGPDWLATARYVAMSAFGLMSALALMSLYSPRFYTPLGGLMLIVSVVPLLSLMASNHWIDALGGFPAIGSGQGIIKYFALLTLALVWLIPGSLRPNAIIGMTYFPVGLVLLWIGGMKFTSIEASGIESLVSSSPILSWLYTFFDVQQASNLIGIYDIVALTILAGGLQVRWLFWPGLVLSLAVFFTTQTFLASYPGSWNRAGILSSSGIFLIKDLWFIANLLVLIDIRHRPPEVQDSTGKLPTADTQSIGPEFL